MENKTAIVTGAYGKIGKAIASEIASNQQYKVVLIGRDETQLITSVDDIIKETLNNNVIYKVVDLSRKASVVDLANEWDEPLDILINNAATTPVQRIETPEGIELQFATNVLGYLWMMLNMEQFMTGQGDARIVNVASYWAGNLDIKDLEFKKRRYNNDKAYRQSKQADRMLTMVMADLFREKGISVNACHPGDVSSKLSNNLGFGGYESPDQGAETPAWLALSDEVRGITGQYFEHKSIRTCSLSSHKELNNQLYELCLEY